MLTAEGHIPLACTAAPQTAAPISGSYGWHKRPGVEDDKVVEEFDHHMSVRRIDEAPRVTKPYTEEQWEAIDSLGRYIDSALCEWDVRLTMGGEPTFVGIDDRDADEWNMAALGGQKRARAMDVVKRLHRSRPGPCSLRPRQVVPGESLPPGVRLLLARDREPIWLDPDLVADESKEYGFAPPTPSGS